jgi:hypothetical protein
MRAMQLAMQYRFEGTERFELVRELGSGGMGVVHLARDRKRDVQVALKTLHRLDGPGLTRLKHEFRALADLAHPNLVTLYELFGEDDGWFFTMELVDGVPFHRWTAAQPRPGEPDLLLTTTIRARDLERRHPPVPAAAQASPDRLPRPVADLQRLRAALRGLTDGVQALHDAGTLHRDLKPSNVLVTPSGRVVVLDFGLAQGSEQPRIGAEGLEGTPQFVAPELVLGEAPGPASDWYAVGVMLYQALTGRFPIQGPHAPATLLQKTRRDPEPASAHAEGVPEDLDRLVSSLLCRDPAERAGAAALRAWLEGDAHPAAAPARSEPSFVGRVAELAALDEELAAATAGRPRIVFVEGRSGIGKSALIRRFAERVARDDRATVLAGRCYEREQVPFKALDSLVDALAAHLTRLPGPEVAEVVPEEASALAQVFPVLGVVDAIERLPPPAAPDPSELRARAGSAGRKLLQRLAARRPLVLIIDDLQWGDPDSAALIEALIDPGSKAPILLVGSVRSEAADAPLVRALRASGRTVRDLRLGPISETEATALASTVLGFGEPERVRALVADASGLPYFVAELARWAARQPNAATEAASLEAVIAARVEDLPEPARRLLEASSLAGVPLPLAVLAAGADLDADGLGPLRLLDARSLVRTRLTSGVEPEIEPFHDRIREVVAGGLDEARRRTVHARLGERLAETEGVDPQAVAMHLALGGDRAAALPFQLRAAHRASDALAFDRAVSLYAEALEWADPKQRNEIRERLADALVLAGRASEAAPLYLRCAREAPSAEARAELERKAAEEWLKSGRIDEGVDVLRGVLEEVGLRYPDSQAEAMARAVVRILRLRVARPRRRLPSTPPASGRLARVDAARAAGVGLMLVDPLRGYGFLARFLLDALDVGEPRRVAAGLCLNAVTLCRGGEAGYPKAKAWLEEARGIADRLDDPYLRGLADACEAGIDVCTGRWATASRHGLAAPELLRADGRAATWECTAAGSLARTGLLFHGDLATLRPLTLQHLRAARDVGDRFAATYASVHGWFRAAMEDDVATGREALDEAIARWSRLGFHAVHFWALYGQLQYDLYEGAPGRALERLDAHRAALKRSRILAMQFYRVFLHATEANAWLGVARQGGRLKRRRALRRLEQLAKGLDAEGPGYAKALATVARGGAAELARPGVAVGWRERAAAAFDASEMRLYAEATRGDVGALRARGIARPERWIAMLAPIEAP